MRIWSTVVMAVLLPAAAETQAFQFRSPAPEVTAATAAWQIAGEPIVVQGLLYIPTRDFRPFAASTSAPAARWTGKPPGDRPGRSGLGRTAR